MQNPLKLGFFIQPVHPPSRPYADVLREDREAVVLADRLGYREAFIGEHLVDAAETITSSLAFIANLADACPSITFGTGVLPLANYHPAMAAAQVAMVDHLVHGRLVLGVGPGVPGDAEAIGDLGSDRNRKTQEALEHMCRIWSEEPPYRIEGEFYRTTTERSLDPSDRGGRRSPPAAKAASAHRHHLDPAGRDGDRTRRELAAGPGSRRPTWARTSSGPRSRATWKAGDRRASPPMPPGGAWRAASSWPMTRPRRAAMRIARTARTASTSTS